MVARSVRMGVHVGRRSVWGRSARGVAQNDPHLGYVYPAGGQIGTEFTATVGGQYLGEASEIIFTGQGVQATVGKHNKPLSRGRGRSVAREDRPGPREAEGGGETCRPA